MDKWGKVGDINIRGGRLVLAGAGESFLETIRDHLERELVSQNFPLVLGSRLPGGEPGFVLSVATGIGDGVYPVEALMGKTRLNGDYWGQRVKALRIVFIPPEAEDPDRGQEGSLDAWTETALTVARAGAEGIPWALGENWGEALIRRFGIKMECRMGDLTGEESGLFIYENTLMRLKKTWTNQYQLYKGDWKPDPRYTGD